MHTNTSGGFKETEVNELAVRPKSLPSSEVATTVTPDAQRARASRNVSWVTELHLTVLPPKR